MTNPDNRRIKVLHLRSSGAMLGAENVIIEIAHNSPQFGVEPTIGIPLLSTDKKPDFATQAENDRLNTHIFHYQSRFSPSLAKDISDYVRKHNIDIIHCHGYQEDFYAWLAHTNRPLIATNHLWKKTDLKLKLYARLDALILRAFDKVIAVSQPIYAELIQAGVNKNKVSTISNGVNIAKFKAQKDNNSTIKLKHALGIPPETLVIGMVSSLTLEKGHIYTLEALRNCRHKLNSPIKLLVIGDGNIRGEIEQKVKELQLENEVIFTGARMDIPALLSIMDIYVISSLIEGLPMSLLEAMASGLAVIASNVGDISSVVENGVNGYLAEPKDIHSIEKHITSLINNPETRSNFSVSAQLTIEKNYSSTSMTEAYCKLYRQILE